MTLEEVIANHSEEVKNIYMKLRSAALDVSPRPDESFLGGTKVKMSSYSIHGKMICVIGPYKDHCKLYLHQTDQVNTGSLKLEGKGKHTKTVKVATLGEELFAEIKTVLGEITKVLDQN